MNDFSCEKCFHYEACLSRLHNDHRNPIAVFSSIVNCDNFIDKDCVILEMTEEQDRKAEERLNQKAKEFVELKTKLDNGDRSLELYEKIMKL